MSGGAYGRVLRLPHVAPLLLASVVARLPLGINSLAILLYVREATGSFALAGAVTGAMALGTGLGSPVQARLVDRLGQSRLLVPLAAGHAVGLLGLLLLTERDAPGAALLACSFLTGLAFPPVGPVLRTLWPGLLEPAPELATTAYALDMVVVETIFFTAPVLVAALVVLAGPASAVILSAGLVVGGTAAFSLRRVARERGPRAEAGRGGALGALRSAGIRTLMLSTLPVGFCFGAFEVILPAFAEAQGAPELAGPLIAVWSLASAAGGLLYGVVPRQRSLSAVHLRIALLLPLGYLPLALAPSFWVMALMLIPAGAAIGPLLASRNELVGDVAPAGAETEAYSWPVTALVSGIAFGAAAAGTVIEAADWQTAAVMGAAAAGLGALVAFGRRTSLGVGRAAVPAG